MSSTKPVRQSARQSAIRQQELEAEQEALRQKAIRDEARKEKARQEAALREELALQEKLLQEQMKREEEESRSSRSLSPALSGSSLSSDDDDDSIKQEEDEDEEDDEDEDHTDGDLAANEAPTDGSDLRSNSTVALIYGFLTKFRSLLRLTCPLREITIAEIESGLTATESNNCIEEIHSNLLSNMLNRKKAVDATTWQKVLSETLDAKLRTGELEYDQNPLRYYGDYYTIPTPDRAQILKALIDWVLQEGLIVRQGIEQDNEVSRVEPYGFDQARRIYWHFGLGTLMMYRETKGAKKRKPVWETVATNLEELKQLANSFEKTVSKAEKALREKLRVEIIEPEEERIVNDKLKQERQEKKLQRIAELHQLAATRTTRTRSSNRVNAPKYTFDDDEDEFEEDEYEIYRRPSSRRRIHQDGGDFKQEEHSQDPQQQSQDYSIDQSNGHLYTQDSVGGVDMSRRSSLGHESDSSIRAALQRTRMADGGADSASGSVNHEDQDGDYNFVEDHDDDEPTSVVPTPAMPEQEPVPLPVVVAPVADPMVVMPVALPKDVVPAAPVVPAVPVVPVTPVAPIAPVAPLATIAPDTPNTLAVSNVDLDVDMN
ncbi:cat eye syndrome chromosome region, candidate 2 [Mortierella hygrophila]|uniref:Cat eye syndrome chromosome region, candidate 2 n=1 Tax=Mortierella hygrophila TaxID=979708 RepID=A0A9P6F9M9_9FUNG|nr:cat eye syndrome chromosome region, candidate 2 [Mortierella hygrophila]